MVSSSSSASHLSLEALSISLSCSCSKSDSSCMPAAGQLLPCRVICSGRSCPPPSRHTAASYSQICRSQGARVAGGIGAFGDYAPDYYYGQYCMNLKQPVASRCRGGSKQSQTVSTRRRRSSRESSTVSSNMGSGLACHPLGLSLLWPHLKLAEPGSMAPLGNNKPSFVGLWHRLCHPGTHTGTGTLSHNPGQT